MAPAPFMVRCGAGAMAVRRAGEYRVKDARLCKANKMRLAERRSGK